MEASPRPEPLDATQDDGALPPFMAVIVATYAQAVLSEPITGCLAWDENHGN